jgi:TalC/MipB family fructose-6-phosphate aldolase
MELFIDSADIDEIKKCFALSIFHGVTTTPTFFLKKGIPDYQGEIRRIIDIASGHVHLEAMGESEREIVENAKKNSKLHSRVVSKIPFSGEGIKAVRRLKDLKIMTNMHLIFSLNQAMLAAEAGADYVCPLIGRLNDIGEDAWRIAGNIVNAYRKHGYATRIMASSIRTPKDVSEAFLLGVDAVTIPPRIIEAMLYHPLTEAGIESFERDAFLLKPVESVMKKGDEMPFLHENDALYEALGVMTEKKIGLGVIIDAGKTLKGIITDGDIRRILKTSKKALDGAVGAVMNAAPIAVEPDVRVQDVLRLMESKRITIIPIVSKTREPLGYVNLHDILSIMKI